MRRIQHALRDLLAADSGTASVEYVVIVAGILLAFILWLGHLGTGMSVSFSKAGEVLETPSTGGTGATGGAGIGNNGGGRGAGGR
jgi:Flp pilus assembly pilin Flp